MTALTLNSDHLRGDMFNFTPLKTLWASFARPQDYYAAAQTPDWKSSFTPAARLFIALTAIITTLGLLKIFQIETYFHGGVYVGNFSGETRFEPSLISSMDSLFSTAKFSILLMSVSVVISTCLIAAIFPFWGRKLSFAVRQRFIFITMIPSLLLSVALFLFLFQSSPTPADMPKIALAMAPLPLIFCGVTAYRGAFKNMPAHSRLWRSAVLASMIYGCTILFPLITSAITGQVTGYTV
ncbi:MAG: hypothetical protein ACPGVT_12025 [Maricaulaceae bacterium]